MVAYSKHPRVPRPGSAGAGFFSGGELKCVASLLKLLDVFGGKFECEPTEWTLHALSYFKPISGMLKGRITALRILPLPIRTSQGNKGL
jgi:hypothetical protein